MKPILSCPRDHSCLMPEATFPRKKKRQHSADLEPSSSDSQEHRATPDCGLLCACVCERACSSDPVSVYVHTANLSLHSLALTLPLFSQPLLPPPLPTLLPRGSAAPARKSTLLYQVPGMKSRAVVAEKMIQQAGWYISTLRRWRSAARLAAGSACHCRCCLPLC